MCFAATAGDDDDNDDDDDDWGDDDDDDDEGNRIKQDNLFCTHNSGSEEWIKIDSAVLGWNVFIVE